MVFANIQYCVVLEVQAQSHVLPLVGHLINHLYGMCRNATAVVHLYEVQLVELWSLLESKQPLPLHPLGVCLGSLGEFHERARLFRLFGVNIGPASAGPAGPAPLLFDDMPGGWNMVWGYSHVLQY